MDGKWFPVGLGTVARLVRNLGAGLIEVGLEPGDVVAIAAQTRREWIYCDLATLTVQGITVGVYPSYSDQQCHDVLAHTGAKILIVDSRDQRNAVIARGQELAVETIICLDDFAYDNIDHRVQDKNHETSDLNVRGIRVLSYRRLMQLGASATSPVDERLAAATPADAATFVYTSGTTGTPRAAMLTHGSLAAAIDAMTSLGMTADDQGFSFMSLADPVQRLVDYTGLCTGMPGAYAGDLGMVARDLASIEPTVVVAAPRVFEAIHSGVSEQIDDSSQAAKRVFNWACDVGRQISRRRRSGQDIPRRLAAQYEVAHRLVYDKVKVNLGGRVRMFVSIGAAVSNDILEFFDAANILILEGWGMAETLAVGLMNVPERVRFGTAGQPAPGVEARIAEDGELLVRGPQLFSGYLKDTQSTMVAFTNDGYLRTGDLASCDADGYYTIIGRKQELIITSEGDNIAPANLETMIKGDPRISQIVVFGDGRPYLTALISVNDDLRGELDEQALTLLVETVVAAKNLELARVEQIRKFRLLPHDLTEETGELTPTLKVKRRVVEEKFSYLIEEMYTEQAPGVSA